MWQQNLRRLMIQKFDVGHEWNFSDSESKKLKDFYEASYLLLECIDGSPNQLQHKLKSSILPHAPRRESSL